MARKKKTKRVPKGSHRMPDGTIMKDKAMKRKRGRKVKKAPALNRQEPWFLGRDYSSTSFTQLHQVNKYNHAVEGLEVLRGYTGRQNELDRRINEQKGTQADLTNRVVQAERLAQAVARNYKKELAEEQAKRQSSLQSSLSEVKRDLRNDLVVSLSQQHNNLVGVIDQGRQRTLEIINQRSEDNNAFIMEHLTKALQTSKADTPGSEVGYPRDSPTPQSTVAAATPGTEVGYPRDSPTPQSTVAAALLGQVSPTTQYRPVSPPSPSAGFRRLTRLTRLGNPETSDFDRRIAEMEAQYTPKQAQNFLARIAGEDLED